MLNKCRQMVDEAAKAAGRPIPTDAQYARIEDALSKQMRQLARRDPAAWRTLSRDQQMQMAGAAAMKDIADAAQRKMDNAQRQIVREAATTTRIDDLQALLKGKKHMDGTRAEALKMDLQNVYHDIAGERKIAQGGLISLIEAAGETKGAGLGRGLLLILHPQRRILSEYRRRRNITSRRRGRQCRILGKLRNQIRQRRS